ncbi:VanZ like family protein [Rhizobium sp. NFR07]|uniref:VanZ family protein n=1 Tax=Rhizobium sp. NFR07 TaxID=1566262 RepID=UPI0008E9B1FD|nr:KTSC domain-containing protein [Rhizobium sp. NFR07]SFB50947.1 VanZ like family protein [Rhizobium sp. NFR07]
MRKQFALAAIVVTFIVIAFATLSPLSFRPPVIFTVNTDRFLAFAGLVTLVVIAYPRRLRYALIASFVLPAALEMMQALSPTRHADLADVLIKSAGGVIGCFVGLLVVTMGRRIRRRIEQKNSRRRMQLFMATAKTTELAVQSRMIQSIHFSPTDGKLLLRFSDGRDGLFEGVSRAAAEAMATAKSPGQFYLEEFKPRFQRVA